MATSDTNIISVRTRKETDVIGEMQIPADALYGIHSARARTNFPASSPFYQEWYRALGAVKLACYRTCRKYNRALAAKLGGRSLPFDMIDEMGSLDPEDNTEKK